MANGQIVLDVCLGREPGGGLDEWFEVPGWHGFL